MLQDHSISTVYLVFYFSLRISFNVYGQADNAFSIQQEVCNIKFSHKHKGQDTLFVDPCQMRYRDLPTMHCFQRDILYRWSCGLLGMEDISKVILILHF